MKNKEFTAFINKLRSRNSIVIDLIDALQNTIEKEYLKRWSSLFFDPTENSVKDLLQSNVLPKNLQKIVLEEDALIELLNNNPNKALTILDKISERYQGETYWARVGAAQILLLNNQGAFDAYAKAFELNPENSDVINNLAGSLARLGRINDAIDMYTECLKLNPHHPQALVSKKKLEIQSLTPEDIIKIARTSYDEHQGIDEITSLFNAYNFANEEKKAVQLIKSHITNFQELKSIEVDDEGNTEDAYEVVLRSLLVKHFIETHQWRRGLAVVNQIETFVDKLPGVLAEAKVRILIELDRPKAVRDTISSFLEREILKDEVCSLLRADLLIATGHEEDVEMLLSEPFKEPLLEQRRMATVRNAKMVLGEFEDIIDQFDPNNFENYSLFINAINTKKYIPSDSELKKALAYVDNPLAPQEVRQNLAFCIATVFDKKQMYEQAMHCLRFANEIDVKKLKYDTTKITRRVNNHIEFFDSEKIQELRLNLQSEFTPIFVVGMPRSGTTLTETILGSHSKISAAGELPYLPRNVFRAKNVFKTELKYPFLLSEIDEKKLKSMANAYYTQVPSQFTEKPYVVDKLPHNFLNVGLISILFPESPIVHVQRHPFDCALSNYQQNFKAKHGMLGYSADFVHMGEHFNDYARIMDHWRKLKLNMIEIKYEDLISDVKGVATKLLEFIGVEWEPELEQFHRTKRSVKTASVAQVRQPIYSSSAEKWRNYRDFMSEFEQTIDMSFFDYQLEK